MSLFGRAQRGLGDTQSELVPLRSSRRAGSVFVDADSAFFSSAMWAAIRLRSRLISTMPVDVYRRVQGVQVEVPKPLIMLSPGSVTNGMPRASMREWLSASQVELDRKGNSFGLITERDANGNPSRIDLQATDSVSMFLSKQAGVWRYRIGSKEYDAADVWHERLNVVPGIPMGLSPVSFAAWSIGQNQSALQFGLEWFGNGAQIPGGYFRNTTKTMLPAESDAIKRRYKVAVAERDILVTGNDWEFNTMSVQNNESQFLETQKSSDVDIARYFDVPADLIDAAPLGKSSITYANVTQRNLQFLIMSLGPIFTQREDALSSWLPQPRYLKFNTDALLRMDPAARTSMFSNQITTKQRVPSEVRAMDDLPPFTAAQITEMKDLGILAAPVAATSVPLETGAAL